MEDYYKSVPDTEMSELLTRWDLLIKQQRDRASHSGMMAASSVVSAQVSSPGSRQPSVALSSDSVRKRHSRYTNVEMAYEGTSSPYESEEEATRHLAFLDRQKILGKPFVGAGGRGSMAKPSRVLLGDCVRELYKTIVADWADNDPVIITTAEDLIVVFFRIYKEYHRELLHRYMNGCLLRNKTCRSYDLKKVPEGWNKDTDEGPLMFALRPGWVGPQRFLPVVS